MLKNIFRIVIIILMLVGIILGVGISIKRHSLGIGNNSIEKNIYQKVQSKPAEIVNYYTYGKAFNIKGKLTNVSKDNFESIKLIITDGMDYERTYDLNYNFEGNNILFESNTEINSGIKLDELGSNEYYVLIRLKLNNSYEAKYYSFANNTKYQNIDYYTMTKEGETNRKASIIFDKVEYSGNEYSFLKIKMEDTTLPDDVYDIVIDAGHGGSDKGENSGAYTEADIALDYAKDLKNKLESMGYKVKLTRDDSNSASYNFVNMYDSDGRITTACETKAKLMISFHIVNGPKNITGFEVNTASNLNYEFAKALANNINTNTNFNYSNNSSFKVADGVYTRTFSKMEISSMDATAKKKGYEPYQIEEGTTYLYTIREVGGIATRAYVDGRNTAYSKNIYYDYNQGIECYEIDLGYIKTDLNTILENKSEIVNVIGDTIKNNY